MNFIEIDLLVCLYSIKVDVLSNFNLCQKLIMIKFVICEICVSFRQSFKLVRAVGILSSQLCDKLVLKPVSH